jgi:deazaflavin-dependent oxidoreductase (nitroreductase family)
MTAYVDTAARVPRHISLFSPLLQALLRAGLPVGPNSLITVRGRKSGEPRTAGVAIIEVGGRRWIWAPWGDVNWVRNLRVAGRATLTRGRRTEEVSAFELGLEERVAFFRDVLGPFAKSIPGGMTFVRFLDQTDLNDPVGIARDRRVFELHPAG